MENTKKQPMEQTLELENGQDTLKTTDKENSTYNIKTNEDGYTVLSEDVKIRKMGILNVVTEKGVSFVTMGIERISEAYKTEEEAIEDAKKMTPERVVQIVIATMENVEKIKKLRDEQ